MTAVRWLCFLLVVELLVCGGLIFAESIDPHPSRAFLVACAAFCAGIDTVRLIHAVRRAR